MTHLWEKCIFKAIKSVVWFPSRVKLAHVKNGSKELWKDFHANPVINPAEFLIRPCHFYKFPHRSNSVGQKVSRGGKGVEITSRKRNIKRKWFVWDLVFFLLCFSLLSRDCVSKFLRAQKNNNLTLRRTKSALIKLWNSTPFLCY